MRFQVSTDYAIRILRYLHHHTQSGELLTAQMIATGVDMTYPFFIKLANQLKRKKLITSVQGRNGGYKIARPGSNISIYDVFVAIEGDMGINHCLQGNVRCKQSSEGCHMQHFFLEMQETLIGMLSNKKIADFDVA